MPRPKTKPPKQPIRIYTHSLTPEDAKLLQQLAQNASDRIGWTVSGSAVIRGLLTFVKNQPSSWVEKSLLPLIEQEISQGRVWGSKKSELIT